MLKKRLIPILLMRKGMLVKSIQFSRYFPVGNPKVAIDYFNAWEVDEIVFLDITPNRSYQPGRLDINLQNFQKLADYTEYISKKCFVPLTVGGGIRSISDIQTLLHKGADKVSINSACFQQPEFIKQSALKFGKQCIVVSIDVKKINGKYEVFISCGKEATGLDPVTWAKKAVVLGAGEILLQSMDQDGTLSGYDLELIRSVVDAVDVPVIAAGGVGEWKHLVDGIITGHASAVAAANVFHFTEHSTIHAKEYMRKCNIDIR